MLVILDLSNSSTIQAEIKAQYDNYTEVSKTTFINYLVQGYHYGFKTSTVCFRLDNTFYLRVELTQNYITNGVRLKGCHTVWLRHTKKQRHSKNDQHKLTLIVCE